MAPLGAFLDGRPAWITKPKQLCSLVEGLAQRIVQGRAEASIGADIFDDQELGMTTRDEKQQIGKAKAMGEVLG